MTILGWIIIGIFSLLALIAGAFFVWFNQKKRKILYQIYQDFETKNQNFIGTELTNLTLIPINKKQINYQINEETYYSVSTTVYFDQIIPNNPQTTSRYHIAFENGLSVGYGNGQQKTNHNILMFQKGEIILTNQRLIIRNDEITTTWKIMDIANIELTIFKVNNVLAQGFYLYIAEKRFIIQINDFVLPYLLFLVQKNVK